MTQGTFQGASCRKCDFWALAENPNPDGPVYGHCRRNPPVLRLPDEALFAKLHAHQLAELTHFPVTTSQDWCGEYVPLGGWPQP